MSTLINILRAVHCRSTHHFFAIDALDRIDTPNGRRLASVLLANYREYLNGAKDPDTKFKDFQNHVIHVSDNNWGGAPKACEAWLARVIENMHASDWKSAAYSIGVLSHYFTDPLMPLHTAQHPSEAVVHRPLEWSVCKSYDWIFRRCTNQVSFPLEVGPGWMSKAVLAGAAIAHTQYMPLIEYYDLKKGVQDPPSGLDSRSRAILTEIFDYALTGWARILDRIAQLAVVEIPICPLTFTTVMATVDVPSAWVVSRFTDAAEQRAVKAIFEEYQATGKVVKNLSPELRTVASLKPLPASQRPTPVKKIVVPRQPEPPQTPDVGESVKPITITNSEEKFDPGIDESTSFESQPNETHFRQPLASDLNPTPETPAASEARASIDTTHIVTSARGARINLDSDIVDAPSIGPKTAARFCQIGINTIGQFLAASAVDMAAKLEVNWIDADTLIDWQDQTRLVVQVTALCGYKAQLLVGIDCRRADELATFEVDALYNRIRDYCGSDVGTRLIRSAAVPSREEVTKWILSAEQSVANLRAV